MGKWPIDFFWLFEYTRHHHETLLTTNGKLALNEHIKGPTCLVICSLLFVY